MTYRPIGARIIAYVACGCFVAMFAVVALALPPDVRDGISPAQAVTLFALLVGALAVLHGIGRTRVTTDETGVHILNGYRHHELVWAEVIGIQFGRGAPWAVVDTAEGTVVQLMAIQSADGSRARAAVRRIRAELDAHEGDDDPPA